MIAILRTTVSCSISYNVSHRILCTISLRLFSTSNKGDFFPSPAIFDLLRHKHQFSPAVASKVAIALNRVKDPGNSDSILSFLKQTGFSIVQLEKIVKYRPGFLFASLEDSIKPKIRVFQDYGFCSNDIAKIISSNPPILQLNSETRVIPALTMLSCLLGTNDAVTKLLRRSGWFLIKDLERTLVANIEFLKSCGIPMERILRLLYNFPRFFLLKPGILRESAKKAEALGACPNSNMFFYAIRILSSVSDETWELKLQAFRHCGFSESDIMKMFGKAPQVFGISMVKLTRTKGVLLATGKYHMSCIVNHPGSLCCSIENKYIVQFQILEILESKNLIKNWPSLGTIYPISQEKFFKKFVHPYLSEVGHVYIAKNFAEANKRK